MNPWRGIALVLLLCLAGAAPAQAPNSRDAQRKLDQVKRELRQVGAERRKIESQRGQAARELRQVDENVGRSARALRQTREQLAQQQQRMTQLRRQREQLDKHLHAQRTELAQLLRAAYTVGEHAPLKLLLAQDTAAQAGRLLTYHGYLQRARAARIAQLRQELAGLAQVERDILATQAALDRARQEQARQIAQLERDRAARAQAVAQLDRQFSDRQTREQALGRDAKALEQVLAQLRAAARRAEAARRAAAARAKREAATARANTTPGNRKGAPATRPRPPQIANAQPMQVGGLGWPLAGSLLAGYGGTMPDGRASTGLLIAAAAGTPVRAVANGKVVFAEWMTGYGLICILDHGNGYMSLYAHNDALLRDAGADVKRGDAIASVGNSGGQGRAALYFELRRNGHPVDPAVWLSRR